MVGGATGCIGGGAAATAGCKGWLLSWALPHFAQNFAPGRFSGAPQ
jgi:hypothetical protein